MRFTNPTVLIAEDDDDDQFMIKRAFHAVNNNCYRLQIVNDGAEAIKYMMGEGRYSDRHTNPYPNFIITDLKMPGTDGLAVLEFLRKNPEWAIIPTVVFSGSNNDDDIKKAYMLGASSYHVKPSGTGELLQLISALHGYWSLCEMPDTDSSGRRLHTFSVGRIGDRYAQDGDTGTPSKISR